MQILSLTNNRGTLVDGRCCGGGTDSSRSVNKGGFPPCTESCSTAFWLCLKEYQSNVTAIGTCSFGNVSSHALGQNTFTLNDPVTLQLHFTFRWTVSRNDFFTFILLEELNFYGISKINLCSYSISPSRIAENIHHTSGVIEDEKSRKTLQNYSRRRKIKEEGEAAVYRHRIANISGLPILSLVSRGIQFRSGSSRTEVA